MTPIQALLLSLIEGITEFLPISSTGHLMLAEKLLALPATEFVKSYTIIIQLGAILAVVWLYFKKVIDNFSWWIKIMAAFLPTAVVGLIGYSFIKSVLLGSILVDIAALFLGGLVMIYLEKWFKQHKRAVGSINQLSYKQSFFIGLAQSLSIIPGVSRAAATIFGGMGAGLTRPAATEFSFLLAVPTMAAATGLDLIKTRLIFSHEEYQLIVLGFVGAFISALITVKWLINFVSRHSFIGFGIYRLVLAAVFFLIFYS